MAGTSPDRSQRYESSTESTPGNEPPVRDTPGPAKPSPDPRLAMSRDAAPKPDQATAVFSRRSLLEAAEADSGSDADRGAEPASGESGTSEGRVAAEPETDGPTAGPGPDEADAAAVPGDGDPEMNGGTDTDADTEGPDAGPAVADGDSGGSDAGLSGADAGADAGDGGSDVRRSDADSDGGGSAAPGDSAVDSGDGDPDTGARDRRPETGDADTDAPDAVTDTESGSGSRSGSDGASSDADADAGDDVDADAAGDVSGDAVKGPNASTRSSARSDEVADDQGRDEPDGDGGEPAAGAAAGAPSPRAVEEPETADPARAAEDDADAGDDEPGPGSERGADAPAHATSAARLPAARAGEESDREAAAGTEAAPDADASAEAATDTGTGSTATGTGADAAPKPPRSGDDSKTTTLRVPAAAVRAGSEGGGAAGSVAEERTEPEDAIVAGSVRDAHPEDARPAAADEVEDRSAAARPDAAPDDENPDDADAESRTDGEPEGDGGAEAGPAVDQATAVFRAPRPPAVDQPTTMLKLGGAASPKATGPIDQAGAKPDGIDQAEADAEPAGKAVADPPPPSERTSRFVALKPLDEHAPSRPPAAAPDGPAVTPAEATRAIPQVGPERTTQQPLPPKPPLDLLAELTNTPPPRQTPVRTFIRRVKIWTPLAILLVIVFAVAQSLRPLPAATLALTADESYAFKGGKVDLPWPTEGQGWMDVNGIGTMDSFGEQKPVAIGSVAKAMTAYVILKDHPMKPGEKGETITVDAKGETEGGYDKDGESTLNTVKEGDKLSQYDAIAAIMIPSANNIARLLARWDSNGSEEAFVKKMNAAAKDLGMKNTTYTDPSGLKETTVSTAEDQVKLGNALVKMKALTDITRLPVWYDPSGQRWDNYNRLVPYNNAIGIKTGSTTAAGGNLLFAGTQEVGGETAIVVGAILGQHTPPIIDTVNAVSKTAMIAAQEALTSDTILKKGDVVGHVDDGLGGRTPVVVTKNVSAVGWAGKTVKLELDASATVPHEAKPGTVVGSLIVGNGTGEGVEVPVALQETLTEPGFLTKLTRVS
ncbi:D-alanyl-D-alanine carboxypeptidase [Streptomyces sp. NPDC057438]|uniref:D-alanyl-D-alanine carboxypeptidase n=1 Tax=Streptomyces sp. NPDC057438 TaxID=3346133 RepID=UPI00367AD409